MEGELEWCTKTAHIVGKRDSSWINSFQPFASRNDTVIFPSSPGCHIVTLVEIWVVWKHHFAHPKSIEWLQHTVSGQYNGHNAKTWRPFQYQSAHVKFLDCVGAWDWVGVALENVHTARQKVRKITFKIEKEKEKENLPRHEGWNVWVAIAFHAVPHVGIWR